jgi:drug/metabolite transporter (DMT)-like permease
VSEPVSITPKFIRRLPTGSLYGLASATLFGLSTPFSKLLLARISPVMLAGLLYLRAALGLTFFRVFVQSARPAIG